jgi:hypothetical protein
VAATPEKAKVKEAVKATDNEWLDLAFALIAGVSGQ